MQEPNFVPLGVLIGMANKRKYQSGSKLPKIGKMPQTNERMGWGWFAKFAKAIGDPKPPYIAQMHLAQP